jgi:N-formylglutamate amidohydrolase
MVNAELRDIINHLTPSYCLEQPVEVVTPFIFSSPHSGRLYPPGFQNASRLSALALRSSEDAYIDELFGHVVAQGASFLHALFPRAFLDLNREPYELDPRLFRTQLPPFANGDSLKVRSGLGVIARVVSEGREIYRELLDIDDALTRINRLYFPYHTQLQNLINSTKARFGYAVLIDCHSMPSKSSPGHRNIKPDFIIGDLFGNSCDHLLSEAVCDGLEALGYRVALNKPYAGGFVTKQYGKPNDGVHTLQIEINRALYLDEHCVEKTRGFDLLQQELEGWSRQLIDTLPDLAQRPPLAAE